MMLAPAAFIAREVQERTQEVALALHQMERLGLLMAEKEVQGLSSFAWVSHHANEATPKQTKQTRSVVHLARQWPAAITGGLIAGGCSRGDPDIETRAGGCAAAIGSFPSSLHVFE